MMLPNDLEFAHLLADAADAISTRLFPEGIGHEEKSDGTPVTEADRQIEDTRRRLVADHRPGHDFLDEEYGPSGPQQRRWIVDAIDGTVSFITGDPGWGTLIALQVDGVITVGLASSAPLGERWWASVGAGAWTGSWLPASENPERLFVSSQSSQDTARVAVWPPLDQVSCGDRPFITLGTEIEVHGDVVVVVGGDEPWDVGSIARWNQMIEDVGTSEPVEIELGDGGEPIRVQIGNSRALDDQFCVDVSEFEPLS